MLRFFDAGFSRGWLMLRLVDVGVLLMLVGRGWLLLKLVEVGKLVEAGWC